MIAASSADGAETRQLLFQCNYEKNTVSTISVKHSRFVLSSEIQRGQTEDRHESGRKGLRFCELYVSYKTQRKLITDLLSKPAENVIFNP